MNEHQTEAIANANAHLSNAVLPTYSELIALLIRSEDAIAARAPHASVHGDLLAALKKADVTRNAPAPMAGLRL